MPWMSAGLVWVMITMMASPTLAGETPPKPDVRRFQNVGSVHLEQVRGVITVVSRDDPVVEVELSGPPKEVARLELRHESGRLIARMSPPAAGDTRGNNVSSSHEGVHVQVEGSGNTVVTRVDGRETSSGATGKQEPLRLTLRMPANTHLAMHQIGGTIQVGDRQGFLELTLSQGDASLGKLGDASLVIDGAADIQSRAVHGNLTARVEGSGGILVQGGQVGQLTASITGAGDIRVMANVMRARLAIQGAGDIEISRLRDRPEAILNGAGSMRINGEEYDPNFVE